jgi:molybdate transport system ATP-binding protein
MMSGAAGANGVAALDARLLVRRGAFTLQAELRVDPGEVLALLGPNGSGKSTLLGALAGLIPLESGVVTVSGRVLTKRVGGTRLVVPPEHRGVGLLGQEPLLFPHLSALDNVAFGPQSQGMLKTEARRAAREWLSIVELDGLEDRRPAQLSGGQQQRVALARALAAKPAVLLLDEPLAAVDVQTASLLRQLLRDRLTQTGTTTILVTHDVLDAIVVADRVAIMQEGRIIESGPTQRVLGAPRTPFVAALAGVNLVTGVLERDGSLRMADGRRFFGRILDGRPAVGAAVSAVFRPAALRVTVASGIGTEPNSWDARVAALEPSYGGIRIRLAGDPDIVAEVSPVDVAEHAIVVGSAVRVRVAQADVALHARDFGPGVHANEGGMQHAEENRPESPRVTR